MSLPKIYRPKPKKQEEAFIRIEAVPTAISDGLVTLCDKEGNDPLQTGCNILLTRSGRRPRLGHLGATSSHQDTSRIDYYKEMAQRAGVKLDEDGQWDKDQCINVLANELYGELTESKSK